MESSVLFCYFFYSPRIIVVEEIFLSGPQEMVVWLVTAVVRMVTWTVFTQGKGCHLTYLCPKTPGLQELIKVNGHLAISSEEGLWKLLPWNDPSIWSEVSQKCERKIMVWISRTLLSYISNRNSMRGHHAPHLYKWAAMTRDIIESFPMESSCFAGEYSWQRQCGNLKLAEIRQIFWRQFYWFSLPFSGLCKCFSCAPSNISPFPGPDLKIGACKSAHLSGFFCRNSGHSRHLTDWLPFPWLLQKIWNENVDIICQA